MIEVSAKQFEAAIDEAVENIKEPYKSKLDNLVFIAEDEVTPAKAAQLKLSPGGLLFGLYEGVSQTRLNGGKRFFPDRITIYKKPHELVSRDLAEFREKVNHTVWHEVAHYFGLDHERIHELDGTT